MSKIISLTVDDIFGTLTKEIPIYILNEIFRPNILSELDFQFAILQFLERKISHCNDMRWHIHNCFYLEAAKKYPDLMIFLNNKPIFCIELKFYGFNKPKNKHIYKDINKLKIYFKLFPTLKIGLSLNIYSMAQEDHKIFNRSCKNKITDRRIKIKNLNLKEIISNFPDQESKYLEYIQTLNNEITRRSNF